jgi:hypothetical protein
MVEVDEMSVHEAMLTKSSSSWDENVITLKSLVRILDRETIVKKLIDEDTNQWKVSLMEEIFNKEDVASICGLAISPNINQDQLARVVFGKKCLSS